MKDQKPVVNVVPSAPPVIPDHELLRCIGKGGYGEVWLARHRMLGSYRAVKVVYRHCFETAKPYERELAGIRHFEPVSRSHEGLVDVLHMGESAGREFFYYIMEVADDVHQGTRIEPDAYTPRTLKADLTMRGRLPIKEVVQIGLSLSDALLHLHRHNLVHRDIKPANIIFVNGVPKLADIGLVTNMRDPVSYVGTEGYFPPEGPGAPTADVFSLGKVLYEICTGNPASAFPRVPDIAPWPECDQFAELNEVLLRSCHNDARQRYASAEDLQADLVVLRNGRSIRRLRILERRFIAARRVAGILAVVLLVLGLGLYGYLRQQHRESEWRQRQVGAYLVQGRQEQESSQLLPALLPISQALRLDTPQRAAQHRMRLLSLLDQCPKLVRFWNVNSEMMDGSLSTDGTMVVLPSATQQVQIRDLETGELLASPFGPNQLLRTACLSPDFRLAVTTSQDKFARIYDWKTGELLMRAQHPQRLLAAVFSPTGDQFVTANEDGVARIWSTTRFGTNDAPELLLELRGHTLPLTSANYDPTGKYVATTSHDHSALVWDAATGQPVSPRLPHKSWVYTARFSPDGTRLATSCFNNTAHVWDWSRGREVYPALRHRDGVSDATFSPDGRLILTASLDRTARIWQADTGVPAVPNAVLSHNSRVVSACFHPDGRRVLTVCWDGTARLWDLAGSSPSTQSIMCQASLNGSSGLVSSNGGLRFGPLDRKGWWREAHLERSNVVAKLSRKGNFVVTSTSGKGEPPEVAVYSTATGKKEVSLPVSAPDPKLWAISDNGQWLAFGRGKEIRRFHLPQGKEILPTLMHTGTVQGLQFDAEGTRLLSYCRSDLYLWKFSTGNLEAVLPHAKRVNFAQFSRDGRLVVACTTDDQYTLCSAQVWDVPRRQKVGKPLFHRDGVLFAAFRPDNRKVITTSEDFTARIWEVNSDAEPKTLAHDHQVHMASFSPSGDRVLTVSWDRTARVWDTETGEPLTPPMPHTAQLWHGVFVEEDRFITSDREGNTWFWSLDYPAIPDHDLMELAQLLTGTGPRNSSDESGSALWQSWESLRKRYPRIFAASPGEILRWHAVNGKAAHEDRQFQAVQFHCDQYRAAHPDHQPLAPFCDELPPRETETNQLSGNALSN